MRALDLPPAVPVGHDLGGGVVQTAAVRRPETCAGLVFTHAFSYDSWPISWVTSIRSASALRAPLRSVAGARNFVAENYPDEVAPAVREVVEAAAAR